MGLGDTRHHNVRLAAQTDGAIRRSAARTIVAIFVAAVAVEAATTLTFNFALTSRPLRLLDSSLDVVVLALLLVPILIFLAYRPLVRQMARRQWAEEVRDSFVALSPDIMVIGGADGHVQSVSPAIERLLGFPLDEVVGTPFLDFVCAEDEAAGRAAFGQLIAGQLVSDFQLRVRRKDGGFLWTSWQGTLDRDHGLIYAIGRDISEHKRAETALADSFERFRNLVEYSVDGISLTDEEGTVVTWNASQVAITGIAEADAVGRPLWDLQFQVAPREFQTPTSYQQVKHRLGLIYQTGQVPGGSKEMVLQRSDGSRRIVHPVVFAIKTAKGYMAASIIRDVTASKEAEKALRDAHDSLESRVAERTAELAATNEELRNEIAERRRIEDALRESEERYRRLVEFSPDAIAVYGEAGLLFANPAAATLFGAASAQELADVPVTDLIGPEFRQIAGERIRKLSKQNQEAAVVEGRLVRLDGMPVDVELAVMHITYAGRPALQAVGRDVTERKRAELALKDSFEQLRQALEGAIRTVSLIIEMRDPYTAGHQRRVALLASAIARGLGIEDKRVDLIRLAALIHDIGKIGVPAEILVKPGLLSSIEFDLIRAHARVGHEILSTIEFQLPIADIVLQHHERVDGSGYPSKLAGEAICLEARIIAVADVVEAMASHRPYRPAVGLDAALAEVVEHRGILYDPVVVDVCRTLFVEQGFTFDESPAPLVPAGARE